MRNAGAVLAGLVVGMVVNMAIIMLNAVLHPMPEGADMSDPDAMATYIESLPLAGLLLAMLAHLAQAFVGGWLAARLAGSRPRVLAMAVGVITAAGGVCNAFTLPQPPWFLVELPLCLVVAWVAGSLELGRRARAAA